MSRNLRRWAPRPRVLLGSLLLALFVGVLLVQAYINAEFAGDHVESEVGDQHGVPLAIRGGGPIINTTGGQQSSSTLPPHTIALTFDDGPDPTWTPTVLKILEENGAHATFFVVGSEVARHPALAKRIVDGGNEVGLHTFTHPNLQRIPRWRRTLEFSQTQIVIAQATGVHTNLVRFPYSSKASAIDDVNWQLVKETGRHGYLVVVNDIDSDDWQRPGVSAIVRNATPAADDSAVVLFHDAGGDRAQTVAALREFIPVMKARGYRFTTVTEGLNLGIEQTNATAKRLEKATTAGHGAAVPLLPVDPPAALADRWRGGALLWTVRWANGFVWVLAGLFLVVGLLTVARTGLLMVLAGRHARQRRNPRWSWGPPVTEPVSVIVPAYNEKEGIEAAVRSLAGGDYPEIEVVVVDDGSTDGTASIVERLGLPNVRVARVPNGGKASALNTGIALARHELIVTVDGDTIFEPDSIRALVQPFADPEVGAVAGNVKVGNRTNLVALWQHIEYVIGFNLDRRLYEILRCMPTVPGAIGAFRRTALADVGGISDDTLAEDTDVTMALCRAGWRVVYEERAKAWTEAPTTLEQLYRQRYRWSYGTMQAMWKHRRALVDHGSSGRFGRRGLPFLALFGVALPMLAPVVDIMLVYGLVFWDLRRTAVAWLGMLALQLVTAAVAFRFDRESMGPLLRLPLQQFAYRQLMYLVLIQSATTALTGGRLRWHKLHRAGLHGGPVPAVSSGPVSSGPVSSGVPALHPGGPASAGGSLLSGGPASPGRAASLADSLDIPSQSVAPAVDTWPSTIGQRIPRHPASGRAVAPPVPAESSAGPSSATPPGSGFGRRHSVPQQPAGDDLAPEDLPSAGSPPGGGSGPVYTR